LDRIAVINGARYSKKEASAKSITGNGYKIEPLIKVSNFNWQFHKFRAGKNKDIISPLKAELVKRYANREPKGSVNVYKAQRASDSDAKSSINLGVAQELMEFLKQEGYALANEVLNEITPVGD
jgi:hypothetical protein